MYKLNQLEKNDIYGLIMVIPIFAIFLLSPKTINLIIYSTINFFKDYLPYFTSFFIALFAFFTWKLNKWQQEQFKSPVPEFYFSEPQDLAISEKDKKILVTFLVYFINTGTSPIIVSGMEHRIINLENGKKYKFGETRFFYQNDEIFGMIYEGLNKIPKLKEFQEKDGWEKIFNKTFNTFNPVAESDKIIISNPSSCQKIEELWGINYDVPSLKYVSEKEIDSYWAMKPNKLRIKRYYVKIPYDQLSSSFQIKLILHYYCGDGKKEKTKIKNFKIKPVMLAESFCFYTADIDERTKLEE